MWNKQSNELVLGIEYGSMTRIGENTDNCIFDFIIIWYSFCERFCEEPLKHCVNYLGIFYAMSLSQL